MLFKHKNSKTMMSLTKKIWKRKKKSLKKNPKRTSAKTPPWPSTELKESVKTESGRSKPKKKLSYKLLSNRV